ncbi:hypothetical protein B0T17DRAFT_309198 [Bombardia bombarda]|uniref:Uncharacterized protein n=1 Tax=Bombardia bombarda TaxID=252184 RepID=A0AA39WUU3_9PEZI|nr:hypothetical protein B0T17DRAFT_309198 [Bombardia bombarda]
MSISCSPFHHSPCVECLCVCAGSMGSFGHIKLCPTGQGDCGQCPRWERARHTVCPLTSQSRTVERYRKRTLQLLCVDGCACVMFCQHGCHDASVTSYLDPLLSKPNRNPSYVQRGNLQ